ncbi:MAG: hypothetical protein IPG01_17125 [Chitinophagaceae bacterium]|nr:hypothetical protein [Chitinophagaceae bacterium]
MTEVSITLQKMQAYKMVKLHSLDRIALMLSYQNETLAAFPFTPISFTS